MRSFYYLCIRIFIMTLSIIIPVYRVEGTLDRCVQSVLKQDFNDFEVILVDDGGSDNCPKLCDEWAKRDHRVRVIHQANGGLSAARNAGIDIAKGEYLTFVDSDDYLDTGLYSKLMHHLATHASIDLLEYSVVVREGGREEHRLALQEKQYATPEEYWLQGKAYAHTYAWNKIYRARLFQNVRFPVGRVFEDVHTLPQLIAQAKCIATTSHGYYHYTDNPSGITRQATGKELQDLLDAHIAYLQAGNAIDARYYAHILNIQLDVFELTGRTPQLPHKHYCSTAKLFLLQLLGTKRLCQLNRLIHKLMGRNLS